MWVLPIGLCPWGHLVKLRTSLTISNVKKEIFHDFIAFILEITNCKKSAKSICNPICRYGWQWYYKCTVGDLTLKCPFIHLLVSLRAYLPTCFKYFLFEFITATESSAPKNKCEPQHVWQCLRTEGYTTSKIFTTCLPTVGYTTSKSFHNNRQPSKLALTWWIICQKKKKKKTWKKRLVCSIPDKNVEINCFHILKSY